MTLDELKVGERARVLSVDAEKELRHHFFDMGLTPGTVLTLVKVAPMGDPVELNVRGYELTLRIDDAKRIKVEAAADNVQPECGSSAAEYSEHPHIGESGIYHNPDARMVIPKEKEVVFALAGNQNCGKTTLFNQLTGSNQHVGNFPGVTVDRKDGKIRGENASVVDLPGIYSLSPFTNEEIVTRDFLLKGKPDGIINIIDATNIERNLYLTLQLLELDIPLVIALNMMDEVRENGGTINVNRLESILGVPVIPISASKDEGVDELIAHAIHVARYKEGPGMQDFCRPDGGREEVALHRSLHAIMHLVEDHAERAGIPLRFAASKLIEEDLPILDSLQLDENEKETLDHIIPKLLAN